MDSEARDRRRKIRLIVSETTMVLTVIILVVVLAFLASGYHFNADFEVERQGMLQIYSNPTGANVAVDGEAPWYQRTNTSKVLSASEHEIKLTRDGYDTWSKTVNIREGLLYRLHYPRLFLTEREPESVYDTLGTTFATVSQDHKYLLLANSATLWHLINLDSSEIKATTLNVASSVNPGTIISAEWSHDSSRILLKINVNNTTEWVLLNISEPAKSVNLTQELGLANATFRIFDNSASNLLVLQDGKLMKVDVSARQVSAPLEKDVKSYNFYGSEIICTTKDSVELLKNDEVVKIETATIPSYVTISRFYDQKYIIMVTDQTLSVVRFDNLEEIFTSEISFKPTGFRVGQGGEYVFMSSGINVATLDMEAQVVREWTLDSDTHAWIDDYMVYDVVDGRLIVYDFDGLNRRVLTTKVSAQFPVTITADKWLYYFSENVLMREKISG